MERSLSSSLRERDKEREQHKKDEAVQLFNALLVDLVSITTTYILWIPYFTRVLNSMIQPFSIKSREHKIANAEFLS